MDSSRDEMMDVVADLDYEEETENMTNPETVLENEKQSEELETSTNQVWRWGPRWWLPAR